MKFGSLFSGIGGMDLGLERAGLQCAWQVEDNEFCQKVLMKHWPSVPKYNDVREVGKHNLGAVDLVAGGFPCQDISLAGSGDGINGTRSGLWREMFRIICELRPRYVLVENVAALLNQGQDEFSETLPASGSMRSGQLYRRALWVRHTCDDGCSFWPTPTASMDGRGFGIPMHKKSGRYRQSIVSRVQELVGKCGWRIHPNFTEALMGFPLDWSAIEQSETL